MTVNLDLPTQGLSFPGLRIGLKGKHQAENAATAIVLSHEWMKRNHPNVNGAAFQAAVRAGLMAVEWPGRFERVHENPDVYIDAGHSPGAIERLVETAKLSLSGRRILLLTGVSHDKNVEAIVSRLLDLASEVIATRAHHKGERVARIETFVRKARPDLPVSSCATIEKAVARALAHAKDLDMTVLVAGGLFLAIEARETLLGHDPRALRFF